VFLLALFAFVSRFFDRAGPRLAAWALIAIGSGLGWLFVASGIQTSDLWVAEAIVFLSILQNPHFPLAASLLLALFTLLIPGLAPPRLHWKVGLAISLAATVLAHLQPFTLVAACAILATTYALLTFDVLRFTHHELGVMHYLPHLAVFASASLPWLIYDVVLTRAHPALSVWAAQNETPSPPAWDYLIAFSPALPLALVGAWQAARRRAPLNLFLVAWLLTIAILLYAPLSIQRRFSHGITIPIGLLAVQGLYEALAPRPGPRRAILLAGLIVLALPTNLLVLLATIAGVASHSPEIYLTATEARALNWIEEKTPERALVLSSPQLGLLIPAYTGRRVVYGHPYETIRANSEREAITSFYADPPSQDEALSFLISRGIGYVVYGPAEAVLGPGPDAGEIGLKPVYQDDGFTIFEVPS
jgi:hypothetical protein